MAHRVDDNHAEIADVLEAAGALVVDLSALGKGKPDLLVGFRKAWCLLEIKNPAQPRSKQRLRPGQQTFHALCAARGLPCHVVTSPREALVAVGVRFDDGTGAAS